MLDFIDIYPLTTRDKVDILTYTSLRTLVFTTSFV